ncbi:MAG: Holliday junction branch migration DNA helicase RuvB, partial [Roseomonas sp.]|nr:Holliday junction branch migration DNA helicase RuvB [Roseomonas sp.]
MSEDRITAVARQEDDAAEGSLRPQTLKDFIGQKSLRQNLEVFVGAARARAEA